MTTTLFLPSDSSSGMRKFDQKNFYFSKKKYFKYMKAVNLSGHDSQYISMWYTESILPRWNLEVWRVCACFCCTFCTRDISRHPPPPRPVHSPVSLADLHTKHSHSLCCEAENNRSLYPLISLHLPVLSMESGT